jgi:hypothetical protein
MLQSVKWGMLGPLPKQIRVLRVHPWQCKLWEIHFFLNIAVLSSNIIFLGLAALYNLTVACDVLFPYRYRFTVSIDLCLRVTKSQCTIGNQGFSSSFVNVHHFFHRSDQIWMMCCIQTAGEAACDQWLVFRKYFWTRDYPRHTVWNKLPVSQALYTF